MRLLLRLLQSALLALVLLAPAAGPAAADAVPSRIVFAAYRQSENTSATEITAYQNLFVVNADGTGLVQLTQSSDHLWYDYPQWALGGTKIVYTVRSSAYAGDDNIWIMDADGSHRQQLTHDLIPKDQPKLTADGKTVIFTGEWSEFPHTAIFALHLDTGLVENLTARHTPTQGGDADPKLTADGKHIIYVSRGAGSKYGQPYLMNLDGSDAHQILHDKWLDTDPAMSPDNRWVVTSTFTSSDSPVSNDKLTSVTRTGWTIMLFDTTTGKATPLSHNLDCSTALTPCAPNDGSAYLPVWSPDGNSVAYIAVRGLALGGIYAVNRDGSDPRIILESLEYRISWIDWAAATGATGPVLSPPAPTHAIVFAARTHPPTDGTSFGASQLFLTGPDRWGSIPLTSDQRWYDNPRLSRDRKWVVATVRDSETDYAAEHIVLINAATGAMKTITSGKDRDTDPEFTLDAKGVYFTRYFANGNGSAIMRVQTDGTGLVNLSAVSSGGQATADSQPRLSPAGDMIAFATLAGQDTQIAVMNADGSNPVILTNDAGTDGSPAWSPDGGTLAYVNVSPPSDGKVSGGATLQLVQLDTGYFWQLVSGKPYLGTPVFSPDGKQILYSALSPYGEADIYAVNTDGTQDRDVQPTLLTTEQEIDYR